ncbi:MAG TPA: transposase [Chthonomonadales bacterium]|nr:transposase [Chthonomonadales bacterium]
MARNFLPYFPEQPTLLPASPQDSLPDGHPAYLIRDLVNELDLTLIYAHYKRAGGAPALNPKMMVAILLYAWASDVYSSRKIAALCIADPGGRFLAAGYQPDFRAISNFRLLHGEALAGIFGQSVRLCLRAGMVGLGHVALDGSKLHANASKRKAMSYDRMVSAEEQLPIEIDEYQRLAAEADREEDNLFRKDNADIDIPEELKHRNTRLARIREAKAVLEVEAKAPPGRSLVAQ